MKTAAQKAKERADKKAAAQAGTEGTQEGAEVSDTDDQNPEGTQEAAQDTEGDQGTDGQAPSDEPNTPAPVEKKTVNVTNDGGANSCCIDEADLKTWIDTGYVVKK